MSQNKVALGDPVTEEDILDQEDYFDSLISTQKQLAVRIAHQAGANHPIVLELKYIADLIDYAANRLSALRHSGCFPSQEQIEQQNSQR